MALAAFRRKKPFSEDRAVDLGARTRRQVRAGKVIALVGAGRELIRLREDRTSSTMAALELDIAELSGNQRAQWLDRARRTGAGRRREVPCRTA